MSLQFRRLLALTTVLLSLGATVAGARPDGADRKGAVPANRASGAPRRAGPISIAGVPSGSGATAIVGDAWTADNTPIKQATLRLRNVVTGGIEATVIANDAGRFAFEDVPRGSYVVELLNDAGGVAAVGQAFTIAAGETVATFVRTSTKLPWFAGFFNNSVSAVSSAAASQGVAAITPLARPVSPKQ